jgi:hypothetical protein
MLQVLVKNETEVCMADKGLQQKPTLAHQQLPSLAEGAVA